MHLQLIENTDTFKTISNLYFFNITSLKSNTIKKNSQIKKCFNCNFHSLEVVSRWRDLQLQVSKNYSDLKTMGVNYSQILLIDATIYS